MGKMGRPPKAKGEQKDCLISVRLTADKIKRIDAAASANGMNRSEWVRKTLTVAASAIQ